MSGRTLFTGVAALKDGATNSARGWLAARSGRERALLAGVALVAAGVLVLNGVWAPLASSRAAALQDIARIDQAMAQARVGGVGPAAPVDPRPTATIVADSAPEYGLAIQRLSPEGPRLAVALENADFKALIEWLATLEAEHAIGVFAAELERRPEPGVVSARIVLER
jgi:general secretion pathway protein M